MQSIAKVVHEVAAWDGLPELELMLVCDRTQLLLKIAQADYLSASVFHSCYNEPKSEWDLSGLVNNEDTALD